MFKHVLPNAMSPIIIGFFGAMAGAILGFVGIAFLGLGDESFTPGAQILILEEVIGVPIMPFFGPGFLLQLLLLGLC